MSSGHTKVFNNYLPASGALPKFTASHVSFCLQKLMEVKAFQGQKTLWMEKRSVELLVMSKQEGLINLSGKLKCNNSK